MPILYAYAKIESISDSLRNSYNSCENSHKCDWYASEMIDGAHLALYSDASSNTIRAATRKRFLNDKDIYYNFKEHIALHKDWLHELSKMLNQPIIVYGKIAGGKYGKQGMGVHVPSVCEYSIHNDFIIHDVKTPNGFIACHELESLAKKYLLTLAPKLYVGSFAKIWSFPENNLSVIPFEHDLPVNLKNEMKGIVVRPIYSMLCYNKRIIAKKLNRKYIGKNITINKEVPVLTKELKEIAEYINNIALTLNIVDAVISINGGFNYGEIDKLAGKCTQKAIERIAYDRYKLLDADRKNLVNKELNNLAKEQLLAIWRSEPVSSETELQKFRNNFTNTNKKAH